MIVGGIVVSAVMIVGGAVFMAIEPSIINIINAIKDKPTEDKKDDDVEKFYW
jgi:hypothetical protein